MPYLLEVSGSVSSSVDISTVSSGSVVLSYDVPGRIDEDYDEWQVRYNESGSIGLNSVVESGSFSTSTVVSTTEVSSSYFVLELENSKTIEIPQTHPHLYYYKTSEDKWIWVHNQPQHIISAGDYLFGSDGNPVKITTATYMGNDVLKSFVVVDVEEIDNAFYGSSSDGYGVLKHNANKGGNGSAQNQPPSSVNCTTLSSTSIRVDFDAASTEDNSAKYDIRYATNSSMTSPTMIANAVNTSGYPDYSYTVTGLSNSTTYYFQVRQNGGSSNTASAWAPTTPEDCTTQAGVPDAPATPTVSSKTATAITFTWSSVTGATSYNLYFGTNNPPTNIVNGTSTSYTYVPYSSLSNATAYHFRVTATNSSGTSGYSSIQSTTTNTLAGGVPSSVSSQTPVSHTVSWTNPSGTYKTFVYQGTSANPTSLLSSGVGLTTVNHSSLTPGTKYYYRTRTQAYYHDGFWSDYSSNANDLGAHTTLGVSAPTSVSSTVDSTTGVTLSWTNPTYQTATYAEYFYGGGWRTANPNGAQYLGNNVTSWVITAADTFDYSGTTAFNMTQNTSHLFRIRAYQTGVYSSYANVTAYTKPGPPTSVTATANSDELITLSWTGPSGGALTETFMIEFGTTTSYGSETETNSNATSKQFSALQPSQIYYFRIRTRTSAGDSSTDTANATTAAGPDPVFGDELSFGALGQATGNSTADTISDMDNITGGNSGSLSDVAMRDFFVGGCSTTLAGSSNVPFLGTTTLSMVFNNIGDQFMSKIADRADQFIWETSASNVAIVSAGDYQADVTGLSLNGTCTITCTWDANYNGSHDSIDGNRTATKNITVTFQV